MPKQKLSITLLDKAIKSIQHMPSHEIQDLTSSPYKRELLAQLKRQVDWLLSKVEGSREGRELIP